MGVPKITLPTPKPQLQDMGVSSLVLPHIFSHILLSPVPVAEFPLIQCYPE